MTSSGNMHRNLKSDSYSAYIFDLYGTLVDIRTDEEDEELWTGFAAILNRYGIMLPSFTLKKVYQSLCRDEQQKAEERLAERQVAGLAEIDVQCVWRRIGGQYGVCFSDKELSDLSWTFRRMSTRKLRLYPGTETVLGVLRDRGKKVVLLTNAQAAFTLPELAALGLENAFDHILISSEAGVKKPSPAFYDRLWALGFVPQECLMTGNDDICDCWGAANAGMDSLYLRTALSPPLSGPLPGNCRTIRSLKEIIL